MSANLNIIKRDGSKAEFDKLKIENAILKAMKYGSGVLEEDIAKNIADEIEKIYLQGSPSPTVSKVEELVYKELIDHKQELTAKAYEGYRAVQSFKREVNTTDDSILGLLDKSNEDVLNENSNKNGQLASTQRDLMAGEVSKDIARRKLIPAHIVQAHDEGVLHYHDMDYAIQPIHNCMLINLEDMLNNGTVINNKLVESPKSFATACTVTTQIIAQIASGQYGGNSITIKHIAPFLRVSYNKYFDKYKEKYSLEMAHELAEDRMLEELKSGIQTIRYQLSTLHTSNGQSPFSTIYLEIEEGGEFEREEALICEEMIVQRLEGMKNYKGQEIGEEFPKLVYLLDEHNCLEGGKYDYITKLAAKCNTKRLVPDYQSAKIMRRNYDGETFPPMGCRSHLSNWKDENGNYKPLNPDYKNFGEARVNSTTCRGSMIVQNEYYDTVCEYTYDAVNLLAFQEENGKREQLARGEAIPKVILTQEDTQRLSQIQPPISDIVDRYIADWIQNGTSDDSWNAYLSDLEAAGVADLVAIYQNTLDSLDLTDYYASLQNTEIGHGDYSSAESSAAESSAASEAESSVASEAESSVASESAAE